MIIKKNQQGVSMVEVLVALVLLAVGVLGYVALQVRAVDASNESFSRAQALTVMRGLAESMRANMAAQSSYPASVQAYTGYTASTAEPTSCFNNACSAAQVVAFDAHQAAKKAFSMGMHLTMSDCPGVPTTATIKRQCIFTAWGKTTLSVSGTTVDYSDCMSSAGVYVARSTCMMMEAY